MDSPSDTFKKSELMNVDLKINKIRNLIDGHIISIESDFNNIIDDIFKDNIDDEQTADNIIDSVINSVSENNQSIDDDTITSDKNSFSIGDMNIASDVSNFLNTETETPSVNSKLKRYKISK